MLTTNEAARIWNSLDDRQRAQVRAGKLRLEDAADLNIPLGDIELNIAKRNTASRSLDSNIGAPEEAQGEYEGAPARAFDLAQATASLATRQAGGALDMLTPDATAPGLLRRQDEVATGGVYGVSKVAEALLPDVSALTPMGLLNRAARIQEQAASARLATQAADRAAEDARRKIAGKPSLAEETADQFGSIARQQAEEYALSVDRRLSRGHQEAVQRGGKLIDLDNPLGTAGNLINPLNWSDAATAFGPQVAAFMAPTAFAGIALRTARLSEAAQVAGGVTAEILSSAEANARGAADEVRKNGGSDEDARKAYDIVFGSSTAFNAATIGGASAAGLNPVAKLAATLKAGQRAPGTGAVISTATKSAVAEAVGEGPQGYMDQVASNVASGKPLTEGALSSGIAEAFMGAPAGGLSGLVSSSSVVQEQLKKNKELQDEFDRRQAELRAQRESDAANLRAAEEAKAAATAKDKKDLETINQPGAQMEMPFGSDLAGDPTQNDRVPTSVDLFSGETISATKVEQRRAANQAEIDKDPTFYTAEEALEENRRRVEAAKSVLPKTQRKTELSEEVAASIPFVKEGDIKTLPGDRKLTDEQMYAREVDTKAAEKQVENKKQDTFEQRKQAELDHRKALEDAKTTVSNKRNLLSTASINREAQAKLNEEIATLSSRPFNQTPQGQRALPTTIANYVASRKDLVVEEVRNARIKAVNSAEDLIIAEKDRKLDAEIEAKLKAEDDAKAKEKEAADKKKEEDRKAAEEAARPAGEQGELALGAPASPKGGLFEDVSQPSNPTYTGSLTDEEAQSEVEAIRAANAKSRTASGKPAQKGAPKEKTAEEVALEKEFAGAAAEEDTKRAIAAKAKWDKRDKAARKAAVSEALKTLPEGTSEQRGALAAQMYTGWLRDNPEPKAPKAPEVTSETVEKQQKAIEAKEKAKATRATNKKVEKLLKEGKTKEEILADHIASGTDEELPPELEDTVRSQLNNQLSQPAPPIKAAIDAELLKKRPSLKNVLLAVAASEKSTAGERWLANRLAVLVDNLGVKLDSGDKIPKPTANGMYETSTNTVYIRTPDAETVLHEALHAVTSALIDSSIGKNNPYIKDAINQLNEVYEVLKGAGIFAEDVRFFKDIKELLAYGMTNPIAMEAFGKVMMPGKKKTAWQGFKDAIAAIFRPATQDQKTALDAIIEATAAIADFAEAEPFLYNQAISEAKARREAAQYSDTSTAGDSPDIAFSQRGEGVVKFDAKDGIGATPNGSEVDYFGYTTMMRPSEFLSLAAPRSEPISQGLRDAVSSGKAIAPAFLNVDFSTSPPTVTGHEGRSRMSIVKSIQGDEPVPVQIFPDKGLRARHITSDMREAFKQGAKAEDSDVIVSTGADIAFSINTPSSAKVKSVARGALDVIGDALTNGNYASAEVTEILGHIKSLAASHIQLAIQTGKTIEESLRRKSKDTGASYKQLQKEYDARIKEIEGATSLEAQASLTEQFIKDFKDAARGYVTNREAIDAMTNEIIRLRLMDKRPFTSREAATFTALKKNLGTYYTRGYLLHMDNVDKKYAKMLRKQKKNADGGSTTPEDLEGRKVILDAIEFVETTFSVIPDEDKLLDMNLSDLTRLAKFWGLETRADATPEERKEALIDKLVAKQDRIETTPGMQHARAAQLVEEILDNKKSGALVQFYSSATENRSILQKKDDVPLALRRLLGEVTHNPDKALITLTKQINLFTRMAGLMEILEKGLADGTVISQEDFIDQGLPSKEWGEALTGESYGPLQGYRAKTALYNRIADVTQIDLTWQQALTMASDNTGPLTEKLLTNTVLRGLNKAGSIYKKANLMYNPANFGYNLVGGPITIVANGGGGVAHIARAFKAAGKLVLSEVTDIKDADVSELIRAGVTDSAILGSIRAEDRDRIVEFLQRFTEEAGGAKGWLSMVGHKVARGDKLWQELYAMADVVWKITSYYDIKETLEEVNRLEGGNKSSDAIEREAGQLTRLSNITYTTVPFLVRALEKVPLGYILPYTYETFRATMGSFLLGSRMVLGMHSAAKTPEAKALLLKKGGLRMAGAASVMAGISQMAVYAGVYTATAALAALQGEEPPDDEEGRKARAELAASYARYSDAILIGRDGEGRAITFDISRIDPVGPMSMFATMARNGATAAEYEEALKSLYIGNKASSSLARAILNTFDGKEASVEATEFRNLPLVGEALFEATMSAPLIGGSNFTKVIDVFTPTVFARNLSVSRAGVEDMDSAMSGAARLMQLAGVKFDVVDVPTSVSFAVRDFKDTRSELSDSLRNSILNSDLDEKEAWQIIIDAEAKEREAYGRLRSITEAANTLGYKPTDVLKLMRGTAAERGLSLTDINVIANNTYATAPTAIVSSDGLKGIKATISEGRETERTIALQKKNFNTLLAVLKQRNYPIRR